MKAVQQNEFSRLREHGHLSDSLQQILSAYHVQSAVPNLVGGSIVTKP